MNNIVFFEGHEVEVLNLNGQVLFNPYHVGKCLDIIDVKSSIRNFSDKQVVKVTNSKVHSIHFRKLHNTGEKFLTSSGVYKLAFKSRKPNAEEFTDWIADEVLPSIEENGYYVSTEKDDKWIITRQETKQVRKNETDMIQKFVDYAISQGSTHAKTYYTHLTNLANKRCGLKSKERDKADQKTLLRLKSLETLIDMRLETLMSNSVPYKEAFADVKGMIEGI